MSRFYGDFDPAATASTLTETIQSDGSIAGVAQNIFPLSSDLSNTGAGDGSLSSVDALTFSSAVGTPYGPGSALRINDTSPRTRAKVSSSAAAVEMIEFSSAFTFEFWLHRDTDQNSGGKMFIDGRPNGQHSQLTFRLYFLDGKLTHDKGSQTGGTQPVVQTATTAATGVWQHYALARESDDTLRMFYDGAVVLTTSFAFTYDNQATGGTPILFTDPNVTNNFKAYVRDLRIIKDACLYTTAFTVPNEPLTATNDGLILATGEDIRTHSHVWNYTDVYDARFADTWPQLPADPTITFKVWGAGGGGTNVDGSGSRRGAGGAGGFAQGTVTAAIGTEFLLTVGSGGPHTTGSNNQQIAAGTYGGGGAGYAEEQDGGAGGGFSGVFTGSRTQGNAIIIAGGGGGGASYTGSSGSGGGGGGGETGRDGLKGNPGDGGSQSSGGAGGGGNATNGSALQGGRGGNKGAGQNRAGGGGGGGYHGGGGGGAQNNGGDGGGGSGYVGGNSSYTPSSTTNTQGGDGSNGASSSATGGAAPNSSDSDYVTNAARGGGADQSGYDGAIVVIVGETTTVYSSAGEFTFTVS